MRSLAQKFKGKLSIQTHISISMIVLMLVIIVFLSLLFLSRVNLQMQKTAEQKISQIHNQSNASLDVFISSVLNFSEYLKDIIAKNGFDEKLLREMMILKNSNKDISNIVLYSQNGDYLLGTSEAKKDAGIANNDWFKRALKSKRSVYFTGPIMENNFASNLAWVVCVSSQFNYKSNNIAQNGVIMISLNYSKIVEILEKSNASSGSYAYIIDEYGKLIYHPNQQLIHSQIKTENMDAVEKHILGSFYDNFNNKERYIIVHSINNTRWRLVTVAYIAQMRGDFPTLIRFMSLIVLASMFLFMGLSNLLASRISRPIKELQEVMEKSQLYTPEYKELKNIPYPEIASLYDNYNNMLKRNQSLMQQIIVEQDQKRLYELNALQAQINPHFLYNTLDSIIWMEERGKSKEAVKMTAALAKLFRISISRGRRVISVSDEIEHVRNYLLIQAIRFSNKFEYSINVDEEVKQLGTLKLIVQPIVENAIQHGFDEYIVDDAHVEVSCYKENDNLVFCVKDNGSGMNKELVENILSQEKSKRGIGVKNVHQRLQLVFGKEYGLFIKSEEDVGTEVYIKQPIINVGDEVNA